MLLIHCINLPKQAKGFLSLKTAYLLIEICSKTAYYNNSILQVLADNTFPPSAPHLSLS